MILKTKHDMEAWLHEKGGTSYEFSKNNNWSMIWHIQVPSKLRMFLWRLARQTMPTGTVLQHRHMSTENTCLLCGAVDTWKHALISCPMSASVWALAPEELVHHMLERGEENPKDWLFAIHEILSKELFDRLVVSLWAIWGVRRKAIHENMHLSITPFCEQFHIELLGGAKADKCQEPWCDGA